MPRRWLGTGGTFVSSQCQPRYECSAATAKERIATLAHAKTGWQGTLGEADWGSERFRLDLAAGPFCFTGDASYLQPSQMQHQLREAWRWTRFKAWQMQLRRDARACRQACYESERFEALRNWTFTTHERAVVTGAAISPAVHKPWDGRSTATSPNGGWWWLGGGFRGLRRAAVAAAAPSGALLLCGRAPVTPLFRVMPVRLVTTCARGLA